jgi:hypothetical protein
MGKFMKYIWIKKLEYMRAKFINEIQKFERSSDPKTSIGVGKVSAVKKMLDDAFSRSSQGHNNFYDFKIKSLDHIEIFYSDFLKKDREDSRSDPSYLETVWIFKYIEKERYFIKAESNELKSFTHSFGMQHDWIIYEAIFYMDDTPDRIKWDEKYILKLTQKEKQNEEIAKVIVDALNKKYGPLFGLELIEKTK